MPPGYWVIAALIGVSHPVVFALYFWLTGATGIEGFHELSTNVQAIHLPLFLAFSLPLYLAWTVAHVVVLRRFRPAFSAKRYLRSSFLRELLPCAFGALHLAVWVNGMEGNVFGFLFALPLLLACLVSVALYLFHTFRAFTGRFDDPADEPVPAAAG